MNTFKQIDTLLTQGTKEAFEKLYQYTLEDQQIIIQETNANFTADITIAVFPLIKFSKKNPEETANEIGQYLKDNIAEIEDFNVVKGFLNIIFSNTYWLSFFSYLQENTCYEFLKPTHKKVLLEYTGPNSNKALHLGHIRNMMLGYSLANILKAAGDEVVKVNIYNDRGIAICKSMLAWKKLGNNETPDTAGIKGDHFVGKYYQLFDKVYKSEIETLVANGSSKEEAEKNAPIMIEAQDMLLKWEAGDESIINLWKMMNDWVFKGHDETFNNLGIDFEKVYFESENYMFGKDIVLEGLKNGVYKKRADGAVVVDLTEDGLDEKVLLRADGTSIYLTQDLGVAQQRYNDYHMDDSLYVVGSEQDYHFKVLKLALQKAGKPYADGIKHISYGMVDLPSGKMKSREGTVVEADDLITGMVEIAKQQTIELGKVSSMNETELENLYRVLGLGALKFYILKVNAKKRIMFNPEESIDFHGFTGPFIQYTYTRIRSILRKAGEVKTLNNIHYTLQPIERELLSVLYKAPEVLAESAKQYDPSVMANYVYSIAKTYNKFYGECPVLAAATEEEKECRIALSALTGRMIKHGLGLLGIEVPERM